MQQDLARLHDIPIELTVDLDRRMMKVRDVLSLQVGSILKTNRAAGDPMYLLLAGVSMGCGEIVVTKETVSVRITDIWREPGCGLQA